MHLKKLIKWFLVVSLFLIIILSMFEMNYKKNTVSHISKQELSKIKDQINSYDQIYVEGENLTLNASNYKTTVAIENYLNIPSYEWNFISIKGYLKTNDSVKISIHINVNGHSSTVEKEATYLNGIYINELNTNINSIKNINSTYYVCTNNGLYASINGINYQNILQNYQVKNVFYYKTDELILLVNNNKILKYDISDKKIVNINIETSSAMLINGILFFINNHGLNTYNMSTNTIINVLNKTINSIKLFNNNIYAATNNGLYEYDILNKHLITIFTSYDVLSFIFTITKSIYFISNNSLYLFLDNSINKININTSLLTLKKLFYIDNKLCLTTDKGTFIYYNNNINNIFDLSNDNIYLYFDVLSNVLYLYSPTSILGITFYQM